MILFNKISVLVFFMIWSLNIFSQNSINWITWDKMIETREADSIKKKVFIDFYTGWCGWCKRMDASTFQDPIIVNYINI